MSREVPAPFCEGLGVQFPRATHLVICCKGDAVVALNAMRQMMSRLKLTVNEEKTRTCRLPDGKFDFLGYTFGRCYSSKTGRSYIGDRPSKKSVKRMIEAVHVQTSRNTTWLDAEEMVTRLNQKLGGWANYFCLGPVTSAYRFIDRYTTTWFRRWLCKKHKQRGGGIKRYSDEYIIQASPTYPAADASPKLSVGEGMMFCPRAGCGRSARPVR